MINEKLTLDLTSESKQSYEKKFTKFIKEIVCSYYNEDLETLNDKSRKRSVIKLRQICFYLISKNSKMTLNTIGKIFNKNHATVIHSNRTIEGYLIWDKDLKKEIDDLQNLIELKSKAIVDNFDLEKDFYYIDLNNFCSLKTNYKAIILSGYSDEEIENFKKLNDIINIKTVYHKNTAMYILNKINQNNETNKINQNDEKD